MSKSVTPKIRGAFLALKDARIAPGGDEDSAKFQVTAVLPQDHPWWKQLQKEIEATAVAKWGKVPPKCVMPVKDGDDTEYAEFQGNNTVSLSSKRRPEVVDKMKQPVIDLDELGSGEFFRCSYTTYAWEFPALSRKGVSLSLSNVMHLGPGPERWDGGSSADSDFADVEEEEGESDDLLG